MTRDFPILAVFLLILWLSPTPVEAQNQLINGDFEQGFLSLPASHPLDTGAPDFVPVGWTRLETFEGGAEQSLIFELGNGPTDPGGSGLGFGRHDDLGSGDRTAVYQPLDIVAGQCAALTLNLDVYVEEHDLPAGGNTAPAYEWPVVVELLYETPAGQPQTWRHGWYLASPGDGRVVDPGTGLIAEFRDRQVPPRTWVRHTFDLTEELLRVGHLSRLLVGGSGWNFEGGVDNVELVCAPPSLFLNRGRFEVSAQWRTPQGSSGIGRPVQLTSDSGYFWFFSPSNIELLVKILDACVDPFNHFWVFAAGLTNVEVTLTVTDTWADVTNVYTNPLGRPFQPILHSEAFDTCDVLEREYCINFSFPGGGFGPVAGVPRGDAPGDVIFDEIGVRVTAEELLTAGGTPTFNYMSLEPPGTVSGFGVGPILEINNLALGVDLTGLAKPARAVTFEFAHLGGDDNLAINGVPAPPHAGMLYTAPCPLGAVECAFTTVPVPGGVRGTAAFTGTIDHLLFGGQELWIDNFCIHQ